MRGECSGIPATQVGAENGEISSEVSISVSAGHLGNFKTCPVAAVLLQKESINRVFDAYAMLRRFNYYDGEVDKAYLLAVDDEIRKIEALEREEFQRREEAKRKAVQRR